MVSLKQIIYALAVADERHFKRAAEACAVSQSALSTAVSELEKQLRFQIFERDNKQVLITPMGERFLERARKIKIDVDDLYRLSEQEKNPLTLPLSMGVIPTIGPYLLPKVLPKVRTRYPDFELRIVEEQSHRLVEMVRDGELDCAVLALPYATEGLLTFNFWEEDFFLVAHPELVPAELQEISSAELDHSQLMLLKDGHCLKDHALAACRLQGVETSHALEGASLYTLIQMAAGKMGVTLVPEMATDQLQYQRDELVLLHLNEPGPHRRIAFIIRPNFSGVHNIEALKALFREQLQQVRME